MRNDRSEYNRKLRKANPERYRIAVRRHRAKLLGLPIPEMPAKDKPIYKGNCNTCGVEVTRKKADGRIDRCNKCRRREHRLLEYAKRRERTASRGKLVYIGNCAQCGGAVTRYKSDGMTERCDKCRDKDMYKLARAKHPDLGKRAYAKRREKSIAEAKAWAQKNRAKRRKIANAWHKRHRDKSSAAYYKYMAAKMQRIPPWADLEAIKMFYTIARRVTECTGIRFEVDHIYPLRGRNSCGLHIPTNLRVIPKSMNSRKSNLLEDEVWPRSEHLTKVSTISPRSHTSQVP